MNRRMNGDFGGRILQAEKVEMLNASLEFYHCTIMKLSLSFLTTLNEKHAYHWDLNLNFN